MIMEIYSNTIWRFVKFFSRRNMYKYLDQAIDDHAKGKILNVGAGGDIAARLHKKNLKFIEIDIDPKRKPDHVMSVENMKKLKNNSIDTIVCMEVLEHVKDPFKAVNEIKRVLKKGGIFIGSSPFVFPMHDVPHDYFRYTKYGILNLFKNFKCVLLKERNSYIQAVYVLLIRLMVTGTAAQRIFGLLLFPFFLVLLPILVLINLVVKNEFATTGYFYVFKNN